MRILNSNRMTDTIDLLTTPTEYISNINNSDRTICFTSGKVVSLLINIKTLKKLTAYTSYLTLPSRIAPESTVFAATMSNQGIRIGTDGGIMPCKQVESGENIQCVISYVIK